METNLPTPTTARVYVNLPEAILTYDLTWVCLKMAPQVMTVMTIGFWGTYLYNSTGTPNLCLVPVFEVLGLLKCYSRIT